MELELRYCVIRHDSKSLCSRLDRFLSCLESHPLTRVPSSSRGSSVYSRHKCCICCPSSVSCVSKYCSRSTSLKPASEHNLDNFWSYDICSNFSSYSCRSFLHCCSLVKCSAIERSVGISIFAKCWCAAIFVDPELIRRNHCAEKQFDGFMATIEVY